MGTVRRKGEGGPVEGVGVRWKGSWKRGEVRVKGGPGGGWGPPKSWTHPRKSRHTSHNTTHPTPNTQHPKTPNLTTNTTNKKINFPTGMAPLADQMRWATDWSKLGWPTSAITAQFRDCKTTQKKTLTFVNQSGSGENGGHCCCCCCSWLFLVVAWLVPVGGAWWVVGVFKIFGPLPRPPPPDRPSPGPPKISLFFFTLPPEISFFLLSLGGLLVEFWWCF